MSQSHEPVFRRESRRIDSFQSKMYLYRILSDVTIIITYEEKNQSVLLGPTYVALRYDRIRTDGN